MVVGWLQGYERAKKLYSNLWGLLSLDEMANLSKACMEIPNLRLAKMEPEFLIAGMNDLTTWLEEHYPSLWVAALVRWSNL